MRASAPRRTAGSRAPRAGSANAPPVPNPRLTTGVPMLADSSRASAGAPRRVDAQERQVGALAGHEPRGHVGARADGALAGVGLAHDQPHQPGAHRPRAGLVAPTAPRRRPSAARPRGPACSGSASRASGLAVGRDDVPGGDQPPPGRDRERACRARGSRRPCGGIGIRRPSGSAAPGPAWSPRRGRGSAARAASPVERIVGEVVRRRPRRPPRRRAGPARWREGDERAHRDRG